MSTYRVRVKSAYERPGADRVEFRVVIERSDDSGNTWDPTIDGVQTVSLAADAILTITNDETLTETEKRQGIMNLLQAEVDKMRPSQAEEARAGVEALLPNGWPVTFTV